LRIFGIPNAARSRSVDFQPLFAEKIPTWRRAPLTDLRNWREPDQSPDRGAARGVSVLLAVFDLTHSNTCRAIASPHADAMDQGVFWPWRG